MVDGSCGRTRGWCALEVEAPREVRSRRGRGEGGCEGQALLFNVCSFFEWERHVSALRGPNREEGLRVMFADSFDGRNELIKC